jgi:hypothetical protein
MLVTNSNRIRSGTIVGVLESDVHIHRLTLVDQPTPMVLQRLVLAQIHIGAPHREEIRGTDRTSEDPREDVAGVITRQLPGQLALCGGISRVAEINQIEHSSGADHSACTICDVGELSIDADRRVGRRRVEKRQMIWIACGQLDRLAIIR